MIHVLIIDDDVILSETLFDFLVNFGFRVTIASDATEGVALCTTNEDIDVVLCDVVMPEMDGITALKIIRLQRPKLPIIMLTGQNDVETAVMAMRLGAFNYIVKDKGFRSLVGAIHDAINSANEHVTSEVSSIDIGDHLNKTVSFQGNSLLLTETEYDILMCLIEANNNVVMYEDVFKYIHHQEVLRDEARRSLAAHISNLRAKLERIGFINKLKNKRGRGYYLCTKPAN